MSLQPGQSPEMLTCGMCGQTFNPAEHAACTACPLAANCSLVCCPQCGYEMVDPGRSTLARLFKRWLPGAAEKIEENPVQRSLPR